MAEIASTGRELGSMLAVNGDGTSVRKLIEGIDEVWVANLNSPSQTVISGSKQGLTSATRALESEGLTCLTLPVACAFHTPIMAPAQERFQEALAATEFRSPRMPVFANCNANQYPQTADQVPSLLCQQLLAPVRFVEQINHMYELGCRVFLEVGPHGVLRKLVDNILSDRPHAAIATQPRGEQGVVSLLNALGQLHVQGVKMNLDRLYERGGLRNLETKQSMRPAKEGAGPHSWSVNGSYARPAADPPRAVRAKLAVVPVDQHRAQPPCSPPAPNSQNITRSKRSTRSNLSEETVKSPHHQPPQEPFTTPSPAQSKVAGRAADHFADFQKTMRMFLRTQQTALKSLLASDAEWSELPAENRLFEADRAGRESCEFSAGAAESTDLPGRVAGRSEEACGVSSTATVDSLEQRLVDTISQHTGYTQDVLGLDVDLESALGIRLLTRLEIIAAVRRLELPAMKVPPDWFMERMTTARTIREMLSGLRELQEQKQLDVPPSNPPAPATSATAVEAAPTPAVAQPAALLKEIVADRTGYPEDMLELDVNLETELGIDSIKRVEIIAAFRRTALPTLQEPPHWFMERMTAAKTMAEIIAGVDELLRESTPASLTPAPEASQVTSSTEQQVASEYESSAEASSQLIEQGFVAPEIKTEDRSDLLKQVVADRTGYPEDMLDMDVNLETELGIDSIKRVEIIAAFRRAVLPKLLEPPAWFMERMTSAKTMREIVDGLEELGRRSEGDTAAESQLVPPLAAPPAAVPPAVVGAAAVGAAAVGAAAVGAAAVGAAVANRRESSRVEPAPRCVAKAVEAPLDESSEFAPPHGVVIFTDDGGGIAESLASALIGAPTVILSSTSLASRERAEAAIQEIRQRHGTIAGLIHLTALRHIAAVPDNDPAAWKRHVDDELKRRSSPCRP